MGMEIAGYGFFSQTAVDNGHGSHFWSTPDGRKVEITMVLSDEAGSQYAFADKVCKGPVVEYAWEGQTNTQIIFNKEK